jgi:hypothetical protein
LAGFFQTRSQPSLPHFNRRATLHVATRINQKRRKPR